MTQAPIRRSLGAPAVVGIPRGSVLGPLRVVIGAPADSPDVLWLYPADGAQQNAWMVLTFFGHGLTDVRCAHAWFQAEHDVAEPRDVVDAIRDP